MTTLNRGEGTIAPISQPTAALPASDDDRIELLARRVAQGEPLSAGQREWLQGRGSREDAPSSVAADLGLAGFADFKSLAAATLAADADGRATLSTARDVIAGAKIDPELAALFLSKVRRLRGSIPATIAQALTLAPEAGWPIVAERLAALMKPKREAGR
ncbi:hypothetical protein [Methylocystis parvus]|uniref:hypothetical protein n=1 Tax=Methylocystis parvus TaxID=134 RepID=UPI003C72DCCE